MLKAPLLFVVAGAGLLDAAVLVRQGDRGQADNGLMGLETVFTSMPESLTPLLSTEKVTVPAGSSTQMGTWSLH
jgi:hypothetical protein